MCMSYFHHALNEPLSNLVWARDHCRISPSRFLAEWCKRRLNQASFVLLCFTLFTFPGLCLVCVLSLFFNMSSVLYFPA